LSKREHDDAYTGETIAMPRRGRGVRRQASPRRPAQPARRRIWPRVRVGLLALLALALLGAALLYLQIRSVAQQIVVPEVRGNPPLASPLLGGANVLLIGVDERRDNPQEGVRGDTLIVAHLGGGGRWASLLSIPRDAQAELPDVGISKINAAYGQGHARAQELYGPGATPQQGGMALSAEKVEQLLALRERGARIDYTAQINFDGFAAAIDALGGITIDVPVPIVDEEYPTEDFQTMRVEFQRGVQRMDGQRALIYARTRHTDSDFGRAQRQQQVLRAIAQEFRAKGLVGRVAAMPGLFKSLEGTVTTTMPIARVDVLLGLLMLAGGVNPDEIVQLRLGPEVEGYYENEYGNLVWAPEGIRSVVDQLLTRPDESSEAALVQVLNGTQASGLGGRITGELEDAGFRVIVAGNAPAPDGGAYERTLVYDLRGKPLTARRLARVLNAEMSTGPLPAGAESSADVVVILGADAATR
jgi:LCP family protein required for cell wall assembly